jgi:hypothetical protein
MPNVTIELDHTKYAALDALAKEQGLASPEQFLANQVDSLLAARNGGGVNPNLRSHVQAIIEEDRGLLERLAQ